MLMNRSHVAEGTVTPPPYQSCIQLFLFAFLSLLPPLTVYTLQTWPSFVSFRIYVFLCYRSKRFIFNHFWPFNFKLLTSRSSITCHYFPLYHKIWYFSLFVYMLVLKFNFGITTKEKYIFLACYIAICLPHGNIITILRVSYDRYPYVL